MTKMKLPRQILSLVLLILLLTACGSKGGDLSSDASGGSDDDPPLSYSASASAPGFAGDVQVTVTVDQTGILAAITTQQQETPGIGPTAIEKMTQAMLQADCVDVDAVAGATISSSAFLAAAREAYAAAYAQSQGMPGFDPANPIVGVWRWDSNDEDFAQVIWLLYPDGTFIPYPLQPDMDSPSLPELHQDPRQYTYGSDGLRVGEDVLPIQWLDDDTFVIPFDSPDWYYSAVRIPFGGSAPSSPSSSAAAPSPAGQSLTDQLCSGVWVNNGYRFSDTCVYQFSPDGTVTVSSPGASDPWSGQYSLEDGLLRILEDGYENILDYDPDKNIFISRTNTHLVQQETTDAAGRYVPEKVAAEILQSYDQDPYRSSSALTPNSIVPVAFSPASMADTAAAFVPALQGISEPTRFFPVDYDDTCYDDAWMEYVRVLDYSGTDQLAQALSPYFTQEYLTSHFFPTSLHRDGKLYLMVSTLGYTSWDAGSAAWAGFVGRDEIAVTMDLLDSADQYCSTETIYFREENGRYVISGIAGQP